MAEKLQAEIIDGERVWDITNTKGRLIKTEELKVGDYIIDGKKKYRIGKNYEWLRIDKKKKR